MAGIGELVRDGRAEAVDAAQCGAFGQAGRAGGEAQHLRQRGEGVIGGAGEEGAEFRAHGRCVEQAVDGADLGRIPVAPRLAPDHAEDAAGAERHLDEIAVATAGFGRAVIQHAAERFGRQHADEFAGGIGPVMHLRGRLCS